jgi:methyltransferase-like protein
MLVMMRLQRCFRQSLIAPLNIKIKTKRYRNISKKCTHELEAAARKERDLIRDADEEEEHAFPSSIR